MTNMEVSAQIQINALMGICKLSGFGLFLNSKKKSSKVAKAALVEHIKTKYESISITNDEFKGIINYDLLDIADATHVVIGIQYGGKVIVTAEETIVGDENLMHVEGKLGVTMKNALGEVSGKGKLNFTDKEREQLNSYEIGFFSDTPPKSYPKNLTKALAMMEEASLYLSNNQSGKPIEYKLSPLSFLKDFWKREIKTNDIINQIDTSLIDKCSTLFDDLDAVSQNLNDLERSFTFNYEFIPDITSKEFKDLKSYFETETNICKKNLSELLLRVRAGTDKPANFIPIFNYLRNEVMSPTQSKISSMGKALKPSTNYVSLFEGTQHSSFGENYEFPRIPPTKCQK